MTRNALSHSPNAYNTQIPQVLQTKYAINIQPTIPVETHQWNTPSQLCKTKPTANVTAFIRTKPMFDAPIQISRKRKIDELQPTSFQDPKRPKIFVSNTDNTIHSMTTKSLPIKNKPLKQKPTQLRRSRRHHKKSYEPWICQCCLYSNADNTEQCCKQSQI